MWLRVREAKTGKSYKVLYQAMVIFPSRCNQQPYLISIILILNYCRDVVLDGKVGSPAPTNYLYYPCFGLLNLSCADNSCHLGQKHKENS